MALPFVKMNKVMVRSGLRLLLARRCSSVAPDAASSGPTAQKFDENMLEILVCPLSKQPLRYDAKNNELVSDSIGVAFPVVNGIPNLVPQDGRMLNSDNPIDITQNKPDTQKS